MFEQTFKNLDDIMFQEPGCNTELDYVEQSSWMLFLKYLDDQEQERAVNAALVGEDHKFLFHERFRWSNWAAPKDANGKPDLDNTLIGNDLIEFVNTALMPYLRGFKQSAPSPDTVEYKIGEIFTEVRNKFQNGYMLRDSLEMIDQLTFGTQAQKHELSDLYETRIKNMGNAGRNGGQYYTPRPLIRAMIQVINPQLGETIYDGAAGSAGFLCEAFDHLRPRVTSPDELQTLERRTFYGKEQAPLAYVIGLMNMILHGIPAPNYLRTDTLAERIADIEERGDDTSTGGGADGPAPRPEMIQIELKRGHIVNIAATTFWGPDGKPISAKDFIERMFGDLPALFKDEDELRTLWGNPDTRKALLGQLAGQGYDAEILKEVRKAIMAEKSDIFDVLAYIAFSADPITRAERAEAGRAAIAGQYDAKLTAFLNFVLGQYVETGAEDLDRAKLPEFLRLKFGSQIDGANALGGVKQVADSYVAFQRHLYR